jgi:hypothetical protein
METSSLSVSGSLSKSNKKSSPAVVSQRSSEMPYMAIIIISVTSCRVRVCASAYKLQAPASKPPSKFKE